MVTPMLLTLTALLVLAEGARGKTIGWTSNPYLIPPMPQSPTQYLVFHGALGANFSESRLRCELMGGDLADVDDMNVYSFLHQRLHQPVFIGSFLGDRHRETCVALYPGGAVAIPDTECGRLGSICEVPVHGTHGIDLRGLSIPADPAARVGKFSPTAQNGTDLPSVANLGSLLVKDDHDLPIYKAAKGSKQLGSPISHLPVTITVYGSIETDPALPCCRCCNGI